MFYVNLEPCLPEKFWISIQLLFIEHTPCASDSSKVVAFIELLNKRKHLFSDFLTGTFTYRCLEMSPVSGDLLVSRNTLAEWEQRKAIMQYSL